MKKEGRTKNELDILRSQAERILDHKTSITASQLFETDVRKILDELNSQLNDLKIQNEELRLANISVSETTEKYTELFEFAPIPYFALSRESEIVELNIAGANLLGYEQQYLKNKRFDIYISDNTRTAFSAMLDKVFTNRTTESGCLTLQVNNRIPIHVHLDVCIARNGSQCLVTVVNIVEHQKSDEVSGKIKESFINKTNKATNLILEVNCYGSILFVNNFSSDCQLDYDIVENVRDIKLLNDHDQALKFVDLVFREASHQSFQSRGLSITNEIKWYQSNIFPVIVSGRVKSAILIVTDITDLIQASERQRSILNAAMDGFGLLSYDGSILDVNEAYCQIFGISKEELLQMRISDLENQKMELDTKERMQKIVEQGEGRYETQHLRKDGQIIDLDVSVQYQPVDGGQFVVFLHDITDRKQAERDLKESEQKLRNYVDFSPHGIFVANELGNYIDVNPTASKITGYSKDELLSMKLVELLPEESMQDAGDHFKRVVNEGFATGEFAFNRKDGSKGYWTVDAVKLSDNRFIGFVTDITERKKTEKALQQSEELLKSVMELLPVGIWITNKKGDIVSGNAAGQKIWAGVRYVGIEEFREYKAWWVNSGKLIEPYEWAAVRAIQKGETSIDEEIEIECFDGTHKIILNSAVPILKSDGSIMGAIATNQDITSRKEAEKAVIQINNELENRVRERTAELLKANAYLQQAEEKYRTVADFTFGWEYWTDQNGNFIYCSPSCHRITGYEVSEFLENPKLLHKIIYPADLKLFKCHKQNEIKGKHVNHEINFRIIRSDGTIRWIGHVCQPIFDENNTFAGNRGSNRDITEKILARQQLKTSNQKYELLSENISDGIFICRNGIFEYVNKAMCQTFGYAEHELIGNKLTQLIAPEYLDELEIFHELKISIDRIHNIEVECIRKDLSGVSIEFLFNYMGNERMIYGVAHDITEKKQIQKSILKAIIQTEEKEKAYFSKELHDGLGPLLSTIKLYLQWSERANTELRRKEILHKAEEILDEALDTAKEISNKLSPHLLTNHGLSSAIQSFASKLQESSGIQINFISDLKRRLDEDIEAAIYRATTECLNNTIKYAGANKISILIIDADSQLLWHYTDDGMGFNISETLMLKKGLGLFNLQNRIQTIGGIFTMYSEPGHGVDFRITLNL